MQIVRELKTMAQALRPPRNRAKAIAAASISSAELDARGIPSGRPRPSTNTQVCLLAASGIHDSPLLQYTWSFLHVCYGMQREMYSRSAVAIIA